MKINKIGGKTYSDEIVKEIENLIKEKKLKPGDRLPSETDLARDFCVSKTVVREAMRALKTNGLIQSKPGLGAFICKPPSSGLITPMLSMLLLSDLNLLDLFPLRRGLEVEAASLASESASKEDVYRLNKCNEALFKAIEDKRMGVEEDFEFHRTLFLATNNSVFIKVFDSISGLFKEGIKQSKLKSIDIPGRGLEGVEEHLEIIQAVESKDSKRARQAMRRHLQNNEWKTWNLDSHWE